MTSTPNELNDSITRVLSEKLRSFQDGTVSVTRSTCIEIYSTIFQCLVDIFEQSAERSSVQFSNEAVNYLAQMYYDAIVINQTQELDPNIFTQRAKLENIETKEIALMAVMLKGTDFAIPLFLEIKRRS